MLEQLSAQGGRTAFEYDENHRVVTVTDPLGKRSTRGYDRAGNLLRLVDPKGRATRMEYDRLDRLVKVTDPLGGVVHRLLDAVGNLVGVVDQNGNQTSYEYDAANRVKAEVYADGSRLEWDWDLAGNLLVQRDPRGFVTGFEHDALDRLVRLTYTDEPEATFAYDANSNLVERRDGTGTYTFEHDPEDRVSAFTQPTGSRYRVQHDGEGNRTAFFFPDGSCQALTYDPSGRLSQMRTPDGRRTTFHYDAEGLRTRIDRPNGTRTLYEYDLARRLSRVAHLAANGSKVTPDFRLTRDALGNVLNVKDEDSPLWTYGYDDLDRLVQAVDHVRGTTSQWAYDAVGNRLSETVDGATTLSRYNALNQLVQMGATRFWYDLAGNLTRQAGPGSVTGYRFDSRDRLVQVHTSSNQHVHYTYDAVGRMQTRRLGTETRPTRLEWDGWDLAREVAPNGLETTYHVPEGEILAIKRGSSLYQVHADALGSVRTVTDSTGANVASFDFDVWGGLVASSGSLSSAVSAKFVGSLGTKWDVDTGLVYMRHRWYDDTFSAFLSKDPEVRRFDYGYAHGNPTTLVDPNGTWPSPFPKGSREWCADMAAELVRLRNEIDKRQRELEKNPQDLPYLQCPHLPGKGPNEVDQLGHLLVLGEKYVEISTKMGLFYQNCSQPGRLRLDPRVYRPIPVVRPKWRANDPTLPDKPFIPAPPFFVSVPPTVPQPAPVRIPEVDPVWGRVILVGGVAYMTARTILRFYPPTIWTNLVPAP